MLSLLETAILLQCLIMAQPTAQVQMDTELIKSLRVQIYPDYREHWLLTCDHCHVMNECRPCQFMLCVIIRFITAVMTHGKQYVLMGR